MARTAKSSRSRPSRPATSRFRPKAADVFHVYPVGYQGPKQEPSFIGLMSAYYLRAPQIDWQNAYPPRVRPGDTILVHAGVYRGDRLRYTIAPAQPGNPSLGNVFDGTYYLTASGTPDKPIVIKGAGDGEAIFDGDGAQNLFNLMAANYNYFEGITVRNTNVAFLLGLKSIAGASGFTLKRSRIYNVGRAVQDDWSGSKDFYIADNVFVGRHDPLKMMTWWGGPWAKFPDLPELLHSEYAVKVYGQGHVVAYNYFANWHDGIDVATYGLPDGSPAETPDRVPVSIDFYGNDFYNMGDNCMEADGGAHNIRLFRNRCFNAPGAAISAQPLWGGPLYVYQNVVYNVPTFGACKFWPAAGILIYQNTFVGECHIGDTPPNLNLGSHALNVHLANNLILATGAIGFDGAPMSTVFAMTADTEIFDVGLQRISSESRSRRRVRMGCTEDRRCRRRLARNSAVSQRCRNTARRPRRTATAGLSISTLSCASPARSRTTSKSCTIPKTTTSL